MEFKQVFFFSLLSRTCLQVMNKQRQNPKTSIIQFNFRHILNKFPTTQKTRHSFLCCVVHKNNCQREKYNKLITINRERNQNYDLNASFTMKTTTFLCFRLNSLPRIFTITKTQNRIAPSRFHCWVSTSVCFGTVQLASNGS